MKNCNMILMEKQQKYQHYHQVNFKYEYLTGEEILSSDHSRKMKQATFRYFLLQKGFKIKPNKNNRRARKKKIWGFKRFKPKENKQDITSVDEIFPKENITNEIINEIYEFGKWEEEIKGKDFKYKTTI